VTLLSEDENLRRACLLEPSISKVFMGAVPTWRYEAGAPHKGKLSDFLFVSKAAWREKLEFAPLSS
jgi:hypothetical protein